MHALMDQTRYWLWNRTKFVASPHFQPLMPASTISQDMVTAYGDSWEERAFAEDSAGRLGGCVWPPRSYSCNFCKREFRSAQALGGHMNVHRRDRARLKQSSPNPPGETNPHHQAYHPIDNPHPQQAVYTSNPNPNRTNFSPSPLSTSNIRTSTVPINRENTREKSNLLAPSYSLSIIQEQRKASSIFSSPSPLDSFSIKPQTALELKTGDENISSKTTGCKEKRDLSFEDEEATRCNKKQKTHDSTISFLKISSSDGSHDPNQYDVPKSNHGLKEELDLELRLGDRPKVK